MKTTTRHGRSGIGSGDPIADRSTQLAADRTVLAAERTYAAWVRTGLAALASGVGARALLATAVPDLVVLFTSTMLIFFSAFCFWAAVWREVAPQISESAPDIPRISYAMLLIVNGSLVLVAICAIVSIWFVHFQAKNPLVAAFAAT